MTGILTSAKAAAAGVSPDRGSAAASLDAIMLAASGGFLVLLLRFIGG